MRVHLRTCEKYIEKYGPLQKLGDAVTRYPCPYCQCKVDEDDLLDLCLTTDQKGEQWRDPSYFSRNLIRHLQLRRTLHSKDYIDVHTMGQVFVERVLDGSFLQYVHVSGPNSTLELLQESGGTCSVDKHCH